MGAKTTGLDQLKGKLKSRFPEALRANVKPANQKNAAEFAAKVRSIIPEESGDLAATIKEEDVGEYGAQVSEGDAAHPYPLHLEAGHRAANGTIVPAKPHWNPAKRVLKKRFKNRQSRALSAAAKTIIGI